MISFIVIFLILLGLAILLISKSKLLLPMLVIGLILGGSQFVQRNWEDMKSMIPKNQKTKNGKASSSKELGVLPKWETVKECPIHFSGRIFSDTVGPNGERPLTGEVYTECFLKFGYEYKITYSGEHTKYLITKRYPHISWRGWRPQSQGMNKPFPDYNFGALMLRIGNQEGFHPQEKQDFIIFTPKENVKIFGELNVNREYDEYFNPNVGSKIKDSTLSIKIERRPI